MKKRNLVVAIALGVIVACTIGFWPSKNTKRDYAVANSLKEMTENAEIVVEGYFAEQIGTWNMARDNFDSSKESKDFYVEGKLYTFVVEKVYKGTSPTQITVNQEYSDNYNGKTEINPYYFEIKTGEKYILFLTNNNEFAHYYGAFEPWAVRITDGKAELMGNMTDVHIDYKDLITGLTYQDITNHISNLCIPNTTR